MFLPLVKKCAGRFVGRNGAEWDDLCQEGLIDVWRTLQTGRLPNPIYVKYRMSRYCKFLAKQEGTYVTYDKAVYND